MASASTRCAEILNTLNPFSFRNRVRVSSRCGRSPMSWAIPSTSTTSRAERQQRSTM